MLHTAGRFGLLARTSDHGYETYVQHLVMTGCVTACFASSFGYGELGLFTGLAHDLGKASPEFQKRILDPEHVAKVDHSTYGAYEAMQRNLLEAAFAVAGHHSGLPNCGNWVDPEEAGTFCARMKRARQQSIPDASGWRQYVELPYINSSSIRHNDPFSTVMLTRFLFSALVDGDRLDAEYFVQNRMERSEQSLLSVIRCDLGSAQLELGTAPKHDIQEIVVQHAENYMDEQHRQIIDALTQTIERQAQEYLAHPTSNLLNGKRNDLLQTCLKHGKDKSWQQGLYTLTAPTGSGKTNASITFALEHAKTNGLSRIIYVIPYMSIIDQTASKLSELFGADHVLPHYSEAIYQLKEEEDLDSNELRMALASENWEAPIIVTTAVQFFESLFSNKPSKCRKLHNIANSVIIFDEAQTFPVSYLKPCTKMIAELVQNYGCSAILCTATQPALEGLFREAFKNEEVRIPEIGPFTVCDKQLFIRNTIQNIGQQTVSELAKIVNQHAQALCVLNTREATQSLYDELGGTGKNDDGIYCLTTLQTSHDRMKLLHEIRGRLDSGEKCLVASTSLIEAGVDIDFPVAYRELAGLDSILQTAGRCNREGKLDPESCTVSVFSTGTKTPSYIVQNVEAFKIVESSGQDITSDEAISQYFKILLNLRGSKALDKNEILEMTEGKTEFGRLPFAEIAARFKLIDDITVPVYIPQDDKSRQLCRRLERPEFNSRVLFRQLGPYTVNVMPQHLQSLLLSGTVRQVAEGSYVLANTDKYSRSKGLELRTVGGEALFY